MNASPIGKIRGLTKICYDYDYELYPHGKIIFSDDYLLLLHGKIIFYRIEKDDGIVVTVRKRGEGKHY